MIFKNSFWNHKGTLLFYLIVSLNLLSFSLIYSYSQSFRQQTLDTKKNLAQLRQVMAALNELESTTIILNEPGNNIFSSKSPSLETKNLLIAKKAIDDLIENIRKDSNNYQAQVWEIVSEGLTTIKTLSAQMTEESLLIINHFKKGQIDLASVHMAHMDKNFRGLQERSATFRAQLRNIENNLTEQESAAIQQLNFRALNILILGLALTFIVAIAGHFFLQRLYNSERNASIYKAALDEFAIVATTDPNGVITYANDIFYKISGYSKKEILGQTHRLVNSGKMGKEFFSSMWKTIRSGKIWRGEICNKTKDGQLYWVDTVIIPNMDSRGKIQNYTTVRTEVTDKKNLEIQLWKKNELQRAVLAGAPYAIVSTDLDGKIELFNSAAEKMLGYKAEELIGKATPEMFHDYKELLARSQALNRELGKNIEPTFEVLATKANLGVIDKNEWTYVRKDGSRFPVNLSVGPMYDMSGKMVGYLGTAMDISEEKRIHNELVRANHEALKAAQVKSEFLANMSHEIRTPMNGIIGMCNLLQEDAPTPSQREKIKIIQNCSNSLLDIINDVLDFSKLEAGKMDLELIPFDMHSVITEVIDLFEIKASEKGLILAYKNQDPYPKWVTGDVTKFRQVLTNLISNAIKFTRAGHIYVYSHFEKFSDEKVRASITVEDTGSGIAPDVKNKLFSSFSQADASTTRKYGGTGLGLVICKALCEKMGGSISVNSEKDQGSTFTFDILVSPASPQVDVQQKDPFSETKTLGIQIPMRILVAEDNRVNQLVTLGLLEKFGYSADIAANGYEVLESLKRQSYDLIFMDCHMPEMDGFQATEKIVRKYNGSEKRPKIFTLTASTQKEDVERCYACGMDGFIGKPVAVNDLISAIKQTHELNSKEESPLNTAEFLKRFLGLEDIAQEAIHTFLEKGPAILDELWKAIETQDPSQIELTAHTIKSAVSNFHASRCIRAAETLEKKGRARDISNCDQLYQKLKTEFFALSDELKKINFSRKSA